MNKKAVITACIVSLILIVAILYIALIAWGRRPHPADESLKSDKKRKSLAK